MANYKYGDIVIVKNSLFGHTFFIGQVVKLSRNRFVPFLNRIMYAAIDKSGEGNCYWISEDEIDKINDFKKLKII